MSGEPDLIKLYSKKILALAADLPNYAKLEHVSARAKKRSPLCGSSVSVELELSEGRVAGFTQDVKACALGQAAACITAAAGRGNLRRNKHGQEPADQSAGGY